MKFDAGIFFQGYRNQFGALSQTQVNALNYLLSSLEADEELSDVRQVAYMLATVKHECADTFLPITELGNEAYFNKRYGHRADLGNQYEDDGARFRGRGYVQITGRTNYTKFSKLFGVDLLGHPEKALEPETAYKIMTYGMRHGTFTGKSLGEYINNLHCDYVEARRIINGKDCATRIAGYAEKFESILKEAKL